MSSVMFLREMKEGEAAGEMVGAADMSFVMFKGKFTR